MAQQLAIKKPTREEQRAVVDNFSFICLNFFAPLNEIAMTEFMRTRTAIVQQSYYKHKLKHNVTLCFKEIQRLVDFSASYVPNKDTYYSFIDYTEDDMRCNIEELREALRRFLKRKGVEQWELWADVQVTKILIDECCLAFNDIAKEQTIASRLNISKLFWENNPKKMSYLYDQILRDVVSHQVIHIDINESKSTVNAYNKIHRKFTNGKFLGRALKKARRDCEG